MATRMTISAADWVATAAVSREVAERWLAYRVTLVAVDEVDVAALARLLPGAVTAVIDADGRR